MMKYPILNEIPTSRDLLDKFKGYNHNLRIGDGEFYDMKNLTGDDYPVLSPRKKRGTYLTPNKPNGMCSNTNFCYVDGQNFYIGEQQFDLKLTDSRKDLVSIGTNVIVMPDQKYINTVNFSERGPLGKGVYDLPEQEWGSDSKPAIKCSLVFKTGTVSVPAFEYNTSGYTSLKYIAREGQALPTSGATYRDNALRWETGPTTSGGSIITIGSYVARHWDTAKWAEYWLDGTTSNAYRGYCYIAIWNDGGDQTIWDNTVDAIWEESGNGTEKITIQGLGTPDGSYTMLSNTATINGEVKKAIVVDPNAPAILSSYSYQRNKLIWDWMLEESGSTYNFRTIDTPIQITTPKAGEATVPKMDYVIESGNRLWGCRYGTNNEGGFVNEIYASALGDFKNWFKYEGISTDSYTASVGTSGEFTGAVNFGGKPIFFKEDCMHRVFGEYPPYSVQTTYCKGVQKGCSKSLAVVNDVLYYKTRTGICAYDGSLPVEISFNFGDKQYYNAVGGSIGNKYYISMQDEAGEWSMFVYDTIKKMWHKEDDTQATQFCNHQGELYYIDHADHFIHTVKGTGVTETEPIKWGAETGILGATTPDNKYVTKIDLKMAMAKGSRVSLYIEYDSMGDWERLMEIEGLTLNTFTIPVMPRRCDHFRLKLSGEGEAKIFSISKTLEEVE